ncbi:Tigger transposable element-derived protein 6 [Gurleya vavrai]
MSQQELSDFFSKKFNLLIPRRTISNIIKNSEKVFENFLDDKGQMKRSRNLKFASLSKELKEWFSYMEIKNFIITEDIIKTKALQICKSLNIENSECSNGWLCRLKKRNGLTQKILSGESFGISCDINIVEIDEINKILMITT